MYGLKTVSFNSNVKDKWPVWYMTFRWQVKLWVWKELVLLWEGIGEYVCVLS